ncbi:methylated-DNA--[protein]-cysteine S-methyltransferase|uniref:methylated-DNA--[protein]-cysteine S-methyltransferase n=1 Tax=Dendrosporobacter quercicolus TaxID=146817 RepID=A0A1G9YWP4_9FIRM|nr:methylated-DNA--[protein]-cysteine S-methyltransferase [Dendrosporobacter quercicolus]NSL49277.1 methylated-DNA--[protein]-cysteine S-methyltransferase [Dendrosporobacter quercicolus DSM 1736]SDN13578.1 methylated-DNA-[protein]-cysteine S-methyltransferase [Dendrosporobacter quercicolus]
MVALTELCKSFFLTDWGHVAAVWSDQGLWELSFPQPAIELAVAGLSTAAVRQLPDLTDHCPEDALQDELRIYFRGYSVPFTVPVDWRGYSPFQAAVLKHTARIAYGRMQSYGEVALAIGKPKAARAVGGALHINRTPIVVPCHRVVGKNGALTGFGGGLELKKALLLLENEQYVCQ